jgi:hypothetical protein
MFSLSERTKTFYLPIFLIFLGILLRVALYWHNRSFWLDEVALAFNIGNRNWTELFLPLDYLREYPQGAPVGFLLVQKIMATIFGVSEKSLRLFPLFCGILSIFLFNIFVRKIMKANAALIALALFSINKYLIYYSAENKQYSLDVLATIFLILFIITLRKPTLSFQKALFFGVVGAILVWFSHPAIFVLTGISFSLLIIDWNEHNYQEIKNVIYLSILIGLSFIGLYFVSLRQLANNQWLLNFWESKFLPFPPRSFRDAQWIYLWIFNVVKTPGGLSLAGFGAYLLLIGCYIFYKERKEIFWLLTTPFLFTLIASAFHKYPFFHRLCLFLTPIILIFIAQGTGRLLQIYQHNYKTYGIILLCLLFLNPTISAIITFIKPPPMGIKAALEYIIKKKAEGDIIFIVGNIRFEFYFYQKIYGFDKVECRYVERINNIIDVIKDFPKNQRIWILVVNERQDKEPDILKSFDQVGKKISSFQSTGSTSMLHAEWAFNVAAYLYDLNGWKKNPHRNVQKGINDP